MPAPGRLILVGGPPASGKTTLAVALAGDRGAIRLSPDEWLAALGLDLQNSDARDRVEALQRDLAMDLLRRSVDVVLDWGVFHAAARAELRDDARSLGAAVELRFLSGSRDELWERVRRRAADGGQPAPTREAFDVIVDDVQPPDDAELATFDAPP